MNDEKIVADDERYTMVSNGIMVAHDRKALQEYEKRASKNQQEKERLNSIEGRVEQLETSIDEMKGLLHTIVNQTKRNTD